MDLGPNSLLIWLKMILPKSRILRVGLTELPASGRNEEILKHHKLDSKSIANLAAKLNIP